MCCLYVKHSEKLMNHEKTCFFSGIREKQFKSMFSCVIYRAGRSVPLVFAAHIEISISEIKNIKKVETHILERFLLLFKKFDCFQIVETQFTEVKRLLIKDH